MISILINELRKPIINTLDLGLDRPEVWKPEMSTSSGEESKTDVVKEYVQQEEEKIAKRRAKNLPLKFRDLKPVSVARNRAKMQSNV